jgi:RNA polymerase sigma-70 factor (ECF subfamily)
LYTNPSRFDPNRGSLRTFLLTQTHSRSIDLIRSEKARGAREEKQGTITLTSQVNTTDSIEDEIIKMELSESMQDALNKLSKDERDAIVLSYYKGFTYREVAEILNQPEGTVKSRIRAAMSKLRNQLDEVVPEEVQS